MTGLGIALLVAGALVAVAEAHYPAHGIAGGIGVVVMAVGAVLAISGLGAGLLLGLLGGCSWPVPAWACWRCHSSRARRCGAGGSSSGAEALVGQMASCAAGRTPAAAWRSTGRCGAHAARPGRRGRRGRRASRRRLGGGGAADRADPVGATGRELGAAVITAIVVVAGGAAGARSAPPCRARSGSCASTSAAWCSGSGG